MGIFSSYETVFLKEDSEASLFINKMEALLERVDGICKKEIDKQIKIARYGLAGEEKISFELKNSEMDMFVIHDIYLEYKDLSAQIDYLIVAKKNVYVIECKNMIGNIEIDNKGDFIRTYELYGRKIREGIYSPITQNERHLNVLKAVRKDAKNTLSRIFFEMNFENNYKSIVCLANPKTILNDKYAKKEVKEKVVRADQLIAHIKKLEKESKNGTFTKKQMRKLAEFFLELSKPNKSDYTKKYEEMIKNIEESEEKCSLQEETQVSTKEKAVSQEKICPRCGGNLILRTAKRGDHAGSQFYGCDRFPKCRYVENKI